MFPLARLSLIAVLIAGPAWSQEAMAPAGTPTNAEGVAEMQALEAEIRTGKRAFIEEQVSLTTDEAAKFWPIYDAHQEALSAFNKRRVENILAYARLYNAGSLDDASAATIGEEALALEKDEAVQMERTFQKLKKAVPAVKAVRYLQVENKIRAILRFEQAAQVPYVR